MAKAVPRILPEIISGGIDAPIENEPINANSSVAPITIPAWTLPIMIPAIVQVTNGLESIDDPKKYSPLANMAVKARRIAVIIGLI
jgi:hypothetical protein